MPRATKQTVDYFPHYVGDSKTKFMLENRWGNEGYAFWFKMLEMLCRTDGHAYCIKEAFDWEYFISVMNVDERTATDILNKLSNIGKIDSDLWENHKTIWCQQLIDHIQSVYDKRKVAMPSKPSFCEEGSIDHAEAPQSNENDELPTQKTPEETKSNPEVKYDNDSKYYKAAKWMSEDICSKLTSSKPQTESQLQKWADDFRKLEEIDKVKWDDIRTTLFFARNDDFWGSTALSARNFRKNYNRIRARFESEGKTNQQDEPYIPKLGADLDYDD